MAEEHTGVLASIHRRPWPSLFGLLVVLSTVLLLILGSKIGFFLDDWDLVVDRSTASDWLLPHNEHIIVIPAAIYQFSLSAFGMDAFPLHLIAVGLFEASVVLMFFWLRTLIGEALAVLACAVVLFLGAATADLVWAFQMGYFGSVAGGFGALLMLRRESLRGDLWACLLLVISLLFSSMVIPFAAAAAVQLYFRNREARESRGPFAGWWVVAIPALLFVIWWAGWGHMAQNHASLENALKAPVFTLSAFGYSGAVLTGVFPAREITSSSLWALPGLFLAAAIVVLLRRRGRIPPEFVMGVAAVLAFWLLAGLNFSPGRDFVAGRYQYPGVIFLLMTLGGAAAGFRPDRQTLRWAVALAGFAVAVNLAVLFYLFDGTYKVYEERNLSGMTALDISRGTVSPEFTIGIGTDGAGAQMSAADYFEAVDRYGSPGWNEREIDQKSKEIRDRIDQILVLALPVEPVARRRVRPDLRRCRTVTASPEVSKSIEADSSLLLLSSPQTVGIYLGRFGDGLDAPAWAVSGGNPIGYRIPDDHFGRPWRIGFKGEGPVKVCPASPAG